MRNVNLIPAPIREARLRRRAVRRWLVIAGAYSILLSTGVIACQRLWAGPAPLTPQVNQARVRLVELDENLAAVVPRLQDARAKLQSYQLASVNPDWSVLLTALANRMTHQIVLRRCELEPINVDNDRQFTLGSSQPGVQRNGTPVPTHYKLKLAGLGRSQQDVSRFILGLEGTGLFRHVQQIHTDQETFMDNQVISFRVVAEMGIKR